MRPLSRWRPLLLPFRLPLLHQGGARWLTAISSWHFAASATAVLGLLLGGQLGAVIAAASTTTLVMALEGWPDPTKPLLIMWRALINDPRRNTWRKRRR